MGTEPDVPPGTSTSARSPHWDPQGAAGLWDFINYEPRLCFRGECVWLAATRPTVSKQKRSLAPGRGPKSELFSAELAGGCGGRPEKRARIVPVRPPPSALHPGSSTLKQTRWGLSSRGTQLTVCVPAGGRGGAPAVPAAPGTCPFAGREENGNEGLGTPQSHLLCSQHHGPGNETIPALWGSATQAGGELHSGTTAPYSAGLHKAPTMRWHPTLPGVSMPRPCL